MKAIRARRFGGPEVLEVADVPTPRPGQGEVLVRVMATSVNPIDWKLREGYMKDLRLPFIPGGDLSGVIEETGPGISPDRKGEEVYGVGPGSMGAHAEFVVVPTRNLAKKPRTLGHLEAASVPLASMTAWQALFDEGKLRAGEQVLILGASGGVGHFAVQFAKHAKARVAGTASTENVELVRELGADQVIDYTRRSFEDVVKDVDLVVDLVGRDFQARAFSVLKDHGRLVSAVQPPDQSLAGDRGIQAKVFRMQPRSELLVKIAELIDSREVKLNIARVLPLEQASEAEELNRRHEVTGKIVLRVAA